MKDFFEKQRTARRNTWLLLIYFIIPLVLVPGLVSPGIYLLTTFEPARLYTAATPFNFAPSTWNIDEIVTIALVLMALIITGSIYKYLSLRSGGGHMIAEMLGGRPLTPDTSNFREKRLQNIVEEMAIASGVKVPSIYVMDTEIGINAFAAGFSQEDAVIGVTRGALTYLNRDELQGVIGHEFSHILNGDMLLNIRLQGVLHGILMIGLTGQFFLRNCFLSLDSKYKNVNQAAQAGAARFMYFGIVGLLLYIFGYIGFLLGKIAKCSVSRQREFLADAAAVQFTRNPLGLAGALKKIGGLTTGSKIRSPYGNEISHMYFGSNAGESFFNAFSTHPPLGLRISRLDPAFNGHFPESVRPVEYEDAAVSHAASSPAAAHGRQPTAGTSAKSDASFGNPDYQHLLMARERIDSLPIELKGAARNPLEAKAVIYCLLLDENAAIRRKQADILRNGEDPAVVNICKRFALIIDGIDAQLRLPLTDLALPALNMLSAGQYKVFRRHIIALVKADKKIDLFEYMLQHALIRRLDARFGKVRKKLIANHSVLRVKNDISCVLSMLAIRGHAENSGARKAFMKAIRVFEKEMKYFEFQAAELCRLKHFDAALTNIGNSNVRIKRKIVAACYECIAHDNQITGTEAELFRTIAEALDCPVSPF